MRYIIRASLVGLGLAFLAACAHSLRDRVWDPSLCQEGISYQAGFNDGRDGFNMNSSYVYQCREDLRAAAMKGYSDGFEKGRLEYEARVERDRKWMLEMEREQRANQQQAALLAGGGIQGSHWRCEIRAFTDTYEGFGRDQTTARNRAQSNCIAARRDDFFCKNPACRWVSASN